MTAPDNIIFRGVFSCFAFGATKLFLRYFISDFSESNVAIFFIVYITSFSIGNNGILPVFQVSGGCFEILRYVLKFNPCEYVTINEHFIVIFA